MTGIEWYQEKLRKKFEKKDKEPIKNHIKFEIKPEFVQELRNKFDASSFYRNFKKEEYDEFIKTVANHYIEECTYQSPQLLVDEIFVEFYTLYGDALSMPGTLTYELTQRDLDIVAMDKEGKDIDVQKAYDWKDAVKYRFIHLGHEKVGDLLKPTTVPKTPNSQGTTVYMSIPNPPPANPPKPSGSMIRRGIIQELKDLFRKRSEQRKKEQEEKEKRLRSDYDQITGGKK